MVVATLTPLGWLVVYDDGAGGEILYRSTDQSPEDLPATGCLGGRTFYEETIRIDDGPLIHFSDIWVSQDWIVFYKDESNLWRIKNSPTPESPTLSKEGTLLSDARWYQVMHDRFLNNVDNRVGQW